MIVGGGGWGDALLGLFGGLGKASTAEQLNGGATRNFRAHNCGTYGQGGTPNSCNF
ncbi:MAG: ComC/BlpC family peptide pheromone/bacteriocin [Lactobacillus sp.]|nr:ComC/BlpC family peptide pheromone/bacteriocin [Lactobacillus sp.]